MVDSIMDVFTENSLPIDEIHFAGCEKSICIKMPIEMRSLSSNAYNKTQNDIHSLSI